jgi:hypothetical protein
MTKYGRSTVLIKRQFTAIYDRKLCEMIVYIVIFDRVGDCNHQSGIQNGMHESFMLENKNKFLSKADK